MKDILVKCDYCGKEYTTLRKSVVANKRKGYKNYCSIECQSIAKKKGTIIPCSICGKEVYRTPRQIRKSSGIMYCSLQCSSIGNSPFKKGEEHVSYTDGEASYRKKALEYYGTKCSVCGYNIEAALQVHHKDCDRKNNDIHNLDVLCPTHHVEYQLGIRAYDVNG